MDNLTHTVIGFVAGAVVAHVATALRGPRGLGPMTRQAAFTTTGMVGGNLPDTDLLVSYGDGKLGYLLQHRGYTHTLVGCLALAALLFAVVWLVLRARKHPVDRIDGSSLGAMALLAVMLHLGMDSLNSYGVHPFWPFDNAWRYGDSVFIVEPWYWIAMAPLLLVLRPLAGRVATGLLLVAALVAVAVLYRGQPAWPLALLVLVAALAFAGRRAGPRMAAAISMMLMGAVTAGFAVAGSRAASEVERRAALDFPRETFVDHVLEPAPTQPLCWNVLLLQREGARYVARHGVLALPPQSPEGCPRLFRREQGSAPWQPASAAGDGRLRWMGELSLPVGALSELAARCDVSALLQFVRAPYVMTTDAGFRVGDLRFDREPGAGFAELDIASSDIVHCPRGAPWVRPRADLLGPGDTMPDAGGPQ